ncbi:hypothetical protein B7463_g5861, partial [Scytalidium lignicola]
MMESEGGSGGVVVCLGVGGMVDLGSLLGLETEDDSVSYSGVEVWVVDARRPWNLGNIFGGCPPNPIHDGDAAAKNTIPGVEGGMIEPSYKPGKGGIIVFDDGDIEEEMDSEKSSYLALTDMPEVPNNGEDSEGSDTDDDEESQSGYEKVQVGQKRKSWSDQLEEGDSEDEDRPRQRRRSNSSSPIPSSPSRPRRRELLSLHTSSTAFSASRSISPTPAQPPKALSARTLRRRLLKLRRKHEMVLHEYYSLGTSYSEPISSMMYSLASELGREDNDLLWMTIVGVTSMELYGRSAAGVGVSSKKSSQLGSGWLGTRGSKIRQILRDEVRRLNPPEISDGFSGRSFSDNGIIPTTARSPTDTSIRLSPEPKFLLIRHWSLYDSMLHSPYLSARLHIWSESGRKRLHKLLAKMGVSLVQCKQSYTHMDMDLKRGLRSKLLKYSEMYGLDDLVPAADTDGRDIGGAKEGWGFVRSWGWRATLSAQDVGVVVGAILEVGTGTITATENGGWNRRKEVTEITDENGTQQGEEWVGRFWDAYDALEKIEDLKAALPTAQHLHRAILRTGTSLIEKRQIRHLRAFRMCVVKDGPDVALFSHPSALTKLALWIGEAIAEQEREKKGKLAYGGRGTPLVLAGLNETRGVYVVVGIGGGGMGFTDRVAAKERKEKKEAKTKAKELKRKEKEKAKEEKRAQRQQAVKDGEDEDEEEEDETESEGSDSSSDEDEEDEESQVRGFGRNKFGNAFQEVVEETNARFVSFSLLYSTLKISPSAMLFKSTQLDIDLPRNITTWQWLFDSPASPLARFPKHELRGFTNAATKERISYADVKTYTTWLSTALVKRYGLKSGETVALFSPNTIWYPVAMLGVNRVGGVVSGASPAYNVEEMTYALKVAKAKFLMTVPGSMDVAAAAAKAAGLDKKNVFLLEGKMDGFITMKELLEIGKSYGEKGQVPEYKIPKGKNNFELCGFLSFSSGTTGLPKAVMIAHQNVIAQCLQIQQITPESHKKVLAVLPSFHITGLVHVLHLPILLNAEVYMLPSFTMKGMLDTVAEYKISELLLVPPILIRLVRDPIVDQYDLRGVTRFSSGAAPLSEEILQQLKAKFPWTGFKQGYGMTESCSCITAHPPEKYGYEYAHKVGTICASTEVKIVDENGNELGVGKPGELLARGPQIVMGYLDNDEATKRTFDEDGWLHTGDEAMIDEEGMITITDRIKEMIKVRGIGVAPAELEDLLLGHEFVEDCAVLGMPDDYSGEKPKAYVVPKPSAPEPRKLGEELLKYVREKKVRHKWVKEIEFVDVIPKSASGKILRRVLRDRANGTDRSVVVRDGVIEKAKL